MASIKSTIEFLSLTRAHLFSFQLILSPVISLFTLARPTTSHHFFILVAFGLTGEKAGGS